MLCPPTLQLERRRDAARELNERTVEERRPHLDRPLVELAGHHHEVLLRKVELAMLVDECVESVQTGQVGHDRRQLVERIPVPARRPYGWREESRTFCGRESPQQELRTDLRRVGQRSEVSFEK